MLHDIYPIKLFGIYTCCRAFKLLKRIFYISEIDDLGLRFFSPSNDDVSMKACPVGSDEHRIIASAAIISSSFVKIISPTRTPAHCIFYQELPLHT